MNQQCRCRGRTWSKAYAKSFIAISQQPVEESMMNELILHDRTSLFTVHIHHHSLIHEQANSISTSKKTTLFDELGNWPLQRTRRREVVDSAPPGRSRSTPPAHKGPGRWMAPFPCHGHSPSIDEVLEHERRGGEVSGKMEEEDPAAASGSGDGEAGSSSRG